MTDYKTEVTAIDITSLGVLEARVTCFDECSSEVNIGGGIHNVDSWRELSAQIEAAILAIRQPCSAKVGE